MAQKVCVIGGAGQLGAELMKAFGDHAVGLTHQDIDVIDSLAVQRSLEEIRPSCVINTAAFHRVDDCECDAEKSFLVNAVGAFHVARAAHEVGAVVIYISTDYVFGNEKQEYSESDCPHPLNVYGASKLAGEQLTALVNPRHYIVRTSALFGPHASGKGHNFVTLMLARAKEGAEIHVVDDQYTAPTYAPDLAVAIKELVVRQPAFGVYHITNSGSCSWHQFAREIFRQSGITPRLTSVPAASRPGVAARPISTVLKSTRLHEAEIPALRDWKEALGEYIKGIG